MIPLEERLTEVLALRGKLTLRGAMHSTGIRPPDPKGGAMLCEHGAVLAKDGRCSDCKKEADRRLYRSRQYMKAMAILVERGVAVQAGKGLWRYAGPPVQPAPRKLPALPAEPVTPDAAPSVYMTVSTAGATTTLPTMMMPDGNHGDGSTARQLARLGRRDAGHEGCVFCEYHERQSWADHDRRSGSYESPREYIEQYGFRADDHQACDICERIEEQQRERERLQDEAERDERRQQEIRRSLYHAAMDRGEAYAYQSDGRRIRRDGSLCYCEPCDTRVARHNRRAARTSGMADFTADIDRLTESLREAGRHITWRVTRDDDGASDLTTLTMTHGPEEGNDGS